MTIPHIYTGDCLNVLERQPIGSVNLIITSPPYAGKRGAVKPDDYVNWFIPRAAEFYRVLANDGSFILNIKECVIDGVRHPYVMQLVAALSAVGWWRHVETYLWHKKNAAPGKWPNRFRDGWEYLFHFVKQKNFYMNQEAVMVPVGSWAKKRLGALSSEDKKRHNSETGSGIGRNVSKWVGRDKVYPDNVLHMAAECANKGHSAVFPVDLPRWFIRLLSRPGDIVLDPFAGSGTTAVAAVQEHRRYIMIEKDVDYSRVCATRIKKAGVVWVKRLASTFRR